MFDPRFTQMAHNLIQYSVHLQPGEKVLIHNIGERTELAQALIDAAYEAGGQPFLQLENPRLQRHLVQHATEEQLRLQAEHELAFMKEMDAYIGIRASSNSYEMGGIPADQMKRYSSLFRPVTDQRCAHTKWCVMRYPNEAMAQAAGKNTEEFADFYFDVCCLDYSKMAAAMEHLVALMNRTDKVRLVAPGTDLTFSIKDIPAVPCSGQCNIPDGEVFTAPVKDSVNGVISYNTPSLRDGFTFENIVLTFKDGKIVDAKANDTARINEIFDIDEGARYVGEFAIGVNPYVLHPMKDTLFDEKIAGSIHFTPGCCYEGEAENGNYSALHWDLVLIQRPEYGGGEMWFDDVLVRKDGLFVLPELACLNPENLK